MRGRDHIKIMSSLLAFIAVVGGADIVGAFEPETHGLITQRAIDESVLGLAHLKTADDPLRQETERVLNALGIWKGLLPQPLGLKGDCEPIPDKDYGLGRFYFDGPRRSRLYCRSVNHFDLSKRRVSRSWEGTIEDWVITGVIREDDTLEEVEFLMLDDPNQIDSVGSCPVSIVRRLDCRQQRVFNHFFDPYNNIGLSFDAQRNMEWLKQWTHGAPITVLPGGILKLGWKSPAWGFGSSELSPGETVDDWTLGNQYTVWDMHESLFRGLTGHTLKNGDLVRLAPSQRQRNRWLATSFRALGDLLHLNQDMGQPQHTRNDPHGGNFIAGHMSWFEKYVNARALRDLEEMQSVDIELPCHAGGDPIFLPLSFESPYKKPPRFPHYLDYWTTSLGRENSDNDGRGLADYTNRGFFTHGTNLGDSDYPSPSRNPEDYTERAAGTLLGCSEGVHLQILEGKVWDGLLGKSVSSPLTAKSSLLKGGYTLNRYIYDAIADLVVPRTVGYSTGLINHVFRGKLDIEPPKEGVYALGDHSHEQGFKTIKTKVTNKTEDISNAPQAMSGGYLVGVVRFHRNTCYKSNLKGEYWFDNSPSTCRSGMSDKDDLEQEIVVSKPKSFKLAANATEDLTLDFSGDPIPFDATDIYLQLVYRGGLGDSEPAVVVGGRDLSEPTYFGVINSTDYIYVEGKPYSRNELVSNKDNILNEVRVFSPPCVGETTPGTLQLVGSCFHQKSVEAVWIIGKGEVPNVRSEAIPVKHFVRFAVLGDAESGVFQYKASAEDRCGIKNNLEGILPVAKNQWKDQERIHYSRQAMETKRGVIATYVVHCTLGDGKAIVQQPPEPLGLPDALNNKPIPVDVTF